jgi:glycosyltransferase involved in cell wall biosynthesis
VSRPGRALTIVSTSYPAHAADGAGIFVRGMARTAVAAGWSVRVLCPALHRGAGDPGDPGIRVERLAYAWPRSLQFLSAVPGAPEALRRSPWRLGVALLFSARLAAALRRRRDDLGLVVSHWLLPSALAVSLATPRARHVAIAHGSDVALLLRLPLAREISSRIVTSGADLVFVSTPLRTAFQALMPAPVRGRVQPMGVDVVDVVGGDRDAARRRLGLDGPTVLFLGRLVAGKGGDLAVAVARELPGATLLVAGTGPEVERLARDAVDLGARVRFLGWADALFRRDLLAGADVLLVPSRPRPDGLGEGLPVAALEAIAAGLPVVATRCGGLVDLRGYGTHVTLADAEPLAQATAVTAAFARGRPDERERARQAAALDWATVLPRLLGDHGPG